MRRPQIVLGDEHALVLEGIQRIIEADVDVVGTACDGRTLVEVAKARKPELVLTEISLPLLSGIEAITRIRRKLARTRAVILTKYKDREHIAAALDAGAAGYLIKDCPGSELLTGIREVLSGRSYITPLVTSDLFSTFRERLGEAAPAVMTERQRDVLQLLVESYGMDEIGALLNISRKTVEYHKCKLMETLGVENRSQLLQYAITHGFEPRSSSERKLSKRASEQCESKV